MHALRARFFSKSELQLPQWERGKRVPNPSGVESLNLCGALTKRSVILILDLKRSSKTSFFDEHTPDQLQLKSNTSAESFASAAVASAGFLLDVSRIVAILNLFTSTGLVAAVKVVNPLAVLALPHSLSR